jgi:hypothetical protein
MRGIFGLRAKSVFNLSTRLDEILTLREIIKEVRHHSSKVFRVYWTLLSPSNIVL